MRPVLEASEFFKILRSRDIRFLYHANAIETGLTFMKADALISRGEAEQRGLPQTCQYTDESDKKFGIYEDVFLNFADFHQALRRPNLYGPVLFVVDVGLLEQYLLTVSNSKISVTKINPDKWKSSHTDSDKWIQNISEFNDRFEVQPGDLEFETKKRYLKKWPDIVISGLQGGIPLSCIKRILMEQPPEAQKLTSDFKAGAERVWKNAQERLGIIQNRTCIAGCKCKETGSYEEGQLSAKLILGKWAS